jgi:hypothetical protein
MSGDDRERDWADSLFVTERLFALDEATKRDAKATEDAFHRIILDLLRSRTPSRRTLDLTAGELERLWFPKEYKKQQRRSRAAGKLVAMDHLIDYFERWQGKRIPRTEAKEKAAKVVGVKDIDTLHKRRYRYRKRAGM